MKGLVIVEYAGTKKRRNRKEIEFNDPTRWGDQAKSKFLPCRVMELAPVILPTAIIVLQVGIISQEVYG